jgi:hypothetical protein
LLKQYNIEGVTLEKAKSEKERKENSLLYKIIKTKSPVS